MIDIMELNAIITLAEKETTRGDWHTRGGAMHALLEAALPFLRTLRDAEIKKAAAVEILRQELAIAESNASERSDPASNEENDESIRVLRAKLAEVA
jgi:hypothetical protein